MIEKQICENCKNEFEYVWYTGQKKRRFCGKKCWYSNNGKKLASFNDGRFKWESSSKCERLERLIFNLNKKVVKKDGCWDWIGVFDKDGYGLIPSGKKRIGRAHRISYLIHYGIDPGKKLVCHKCDNPACTNPDHLFLGDHRDNQNDSIRKKRAALGIRQPRAKLTENDVKKIRQLLADGVKGSRIAEDFGVSPSIICEINKRRSWKHVE